MKRRLLQSIDEITNEMLKGNNDASEAAAIPPDLENYVTELQLLYGVPLSYLVADEFLLPQESLRFFYIDNNWTQALADGALSIGRITAADGMHDQFRLASTLLNVRMMLHVPRHSRMHVNHKAKGLLSANDKETAGLITGFLLRSELVRMFKGLEIGASDGKKELDMLRLDTFGDEIALGLFDGEMQHLVIAEPKTGLTFGLAPGEHMLVPKDVSEENLGQPLRNLSIDIRAYKNAAGRLDAAGLAKELGQRLDTEIGAAKLAFELIAVANRAVFESSKD